MSQRFPVPAGYVYLGPAGYHHQQQQQPSSNNNNNNNKDEVISIHGSSSDESDKAPPPKAAARMPRGGGKSTGYHETITIESSDDDDDDNDNDHDDPPPPVRFIQTTPAASLLMAQQQQQVQQQASSSSSAMMHHHANAVATNTTPVLMLATASAPSFLHPHQLLLMQGHHAGSRPIIVPSPNYNYNHNLSNNNNVNALASYNNNNNNVNRRSQAQQNALDNASRRDRQPRAVLPAQVPAPTPTPALAALEPKGKGKNNKSNSNSATTTMDMAPPGLESSSPASDDSEDESSAERQQQQRQKSTKDYKKPQATTVARTTTTTTTTKSSTKSSTAKKAAAFRAGGTNKRKRKLFLTHQQDHNDNNGHRMESVPTTKENKTTNKNKKKPKRKNNYKTMPASEKKKNGGGKMVRCPLCFHQVLEEHVDEHIVVCGKTITNAEDLLLQMDKNTNHAEGEEESSSANDDNDDDDDDDDDNKSSTTEQCSAKPLGNIASLSSSNTNTNMDDDGDDDDEEEEEEEEKKPAAKNHLHQKQQQLKTLGEVNSCSSGGQSSGFSLGDDDDDDGDDDDEIMKEDDDDDDGSLSSSSVLPAVRSKRLAMKRDKVAVWRTRVEDTLREVRQKRQASKELVLKKALATKNNWMSRMRRGSISTSSSSGSSLTTSHSQQQQGQQETFPLLPSAIDTPLDSSYMKDQDYPLPRDDFTTIFLDRHFSNVDDNKIDSNSSDSENNSSSGNDKEDDDEVIDVEDSSSSNSDASPTHQFAANAPEALARKIKEFHLPNRTGVGFEKIETDEDIDKVLESVADIVNDNERREIHEYLAVLVDEPVARIQKRYKKLNKKPESMRLHDTTYENVMSSFRDLFCRRCLTYDCNFHGLAEKRDPVVQAEIARFKETSGSWHVNNSDDGSVINSSNNRLETTLAAGGIPPMCFPVATSPAASSSSSSSKSADTTPNPPMPDATLSIDQIVLCQKLYHIFDGDLEKVSLAAGISQKSISDQVELEPFQYRIVDPATLNENRGKNNKSNMYNPQWIKRIVEKKDHPYFNPCQHEGFCKEDNCTCVANGFFCTKACLWGPYSRNFFRGCNCIGRCMAKNCPCFASNRECDPDLCKRCGACNDPPNQPATAQSCRNDNISMRRHVHLLMCKSKVAGWGLCAKYPLKKGDYIQEYLGEMIPHNEAERRGAIYDQRNQTYLFDLSTDCAVDALRKGNKTRFINHSANPNIMPTIKVVNGDFRIAFFAKRDIPAESELFFDYGRMFFSSQGTFASKPDDNPSGERIKSKDMFAKSNR